MQTIKYNSEIFSENYLSVAQIKMKLADPTFLFGEVGRGSGKTTHMLSPRIDRVQSAMPGSCLVLASSTYKSIFDNILPGIMEYLHENYERGKYYEIGKEPPEHFNRCHTFITNWKHTISFQSGTVIQFVSCDRPESMLGKNAAHLFADELIRIPKDKFIERIMPALRADRAKFGHSHYFMGVTGFSSTPNFETDEDWFTEYEKNMNLDLMKCIIEMAYLLDQRIAELNYAYKEMNQVKIKRLERFVSRWNTRLTELRRGQTYYLRASSFSNLKILGVDYIENQCKTIKDDSVLNTAIFSVRNNRVGVLFVGHFGKQHIFDDSYIYDNIDKLSIGEKIEICSSDLKYCDKNKPLYAGYDPGQISSIVFGQKFIGENSLRELRLIKNFWVIHPEQQEELAHKIDSFFRNHRRKEIFLHYDRAANQRSPRWKKYYPSAEPGINDNDAVLLKKALEKRGWLVRLMSVGQPVIYYWQHYQLLNILFSGRDSRTDRIKICRNECEELISSINHSPLKRSDGRIELDKSSEEKYDFKDQPLNSTQIFTAAMYLLWGEYNRILPKNGYNDIPESGGTWITK